MRAAVLAVRRQSPLAITVAVPVGSPAPARPLAADVDEVLCLSVAAVFRAVGQAYDDFAATTDDEVRDALRGGRWPADRPTFPGRCR